MREQAKRNAVLRAVAEGAPAMGTDQVVEGKIGAGEWLATARRVMAGAEPDQVVVDGPYRLERWMAQRGDGGEAAVYVHRIVGEDPAPLHDHPSDNVSFVLQGKIREDVHGNGLGEGPGKALCTTRRYGPGTMVARSATTRHRLWVEGGKEAVTVWLRGPSVRDWGYMLAQGWVESQRYRSCGNATERLCFIAGAPPAQEGMWKVVVGWRGGRETTAWARATGPRHAGFEALREEPQAEWVTAITDPEGRSHAVVAHHRRQDRRRGIGLAREIGRKALGGPVPRKAAAAEEALRQGGRSAEVAALAKEIRCTASAQPAEVRLAAMALEALAGRPE